MYLARVQTVNRGNAAEAAVLAALARADILVLIPFGEGAAFDLAAVVPPDGDVVRIQVKSGRIRNGCVEFNTCSTDHGSGRGSYVGRAEVIAVHADDPQALFVVPVEACPTSKGYLRLEQPRNNQRRRVRLAADYEFERWVRGLFDGFG
jgi:PD-(D/E)XK endonuclease